MAYNTLSWAVLRSYHWMTSVALYCLASMARPSVSCYALCKSIQCIKFQVLEENVSWGLLKIYSCSYTVKRRVIKWTFLKNCILAMRLTWFGEKSLTAAFTLEFKVINLDVLIIFYYCLWNKLSFGGIRMTSYLHYFF